MTPEMSAEVGRTLLAVVLWKLKNSNQLPDGITITEKEMCEFALQSAADAAVLFHHWHETSVDLKILTKADGDRLAVLHVENTGGTAHYTPPGQGSKEGD